MGPSVPLRDGGGGDDVKAVLLFMVVDDGRIHNGHGVWFTNTQRGESTTRTVPPTALGVKSTRMERCNKGAEATAEIRSTRGSASAFSIG